MLELYKQLKLGDFLVDTHVHLNSDRYDDLDKVINATEESGITYIFDVSVDLVSSKKSLEISTENEQIKSFVGIDPEVFIPSSDMYVGSVEDSWFEKQFESLEGMITKNKEEVIGIGETGMDFYWIEQGNKVSEEEKLLSKLNQERLFKLHLELAQKFSLPLTIHSRGAEHECLEIIKQFDVLGVFHSYTGTLEIAQKIINSGNGLGVNGIITFKNATELQKIYSDLLSDAKVESPIDLYRYGIFLETDGPYLAPHPHRGERNEPKYIVEIFEKILEITKT